MFKVIYRNQARKALEQIPKQWQSRIFKVIESLRSNPYQGKKLKGELADLFSIRVWPYRITYLVDRQTITIVIFSIGHRQGVYN